MIVHLVYQSDGDFGDGLGNSLEFDPPVLVKAFSTVTKAKKYIKVLEEKNKPFWKYRYTIQKLQVE